MTNDELALRLVALPQFRWLPGMLAIVPAAHDGATGYCYRLTEASGPVNSARAFPDLTDAATLGCMLALTGQPLEAAALAAALEAATVKDSFTVQLLNKF